MPNKWAGSNVRPDRSTLPSQMHFLNIITLSTVPTAQKAPKKAIYKNKVLLHKGEHKLPICIYKPIFFKVPNNSSLLI
jgi:CRISPR/Cas system-associated protein endoribonuclease Cas2